MHLLNAEGLLSNYRANLLAFFLIMAGIYGFPFSVARKPPNFRARIHVSGN